MAGAYEKLKEVTRGRRVNAADLHRLIESLDMAPADKQRLLALTPQGYTGKAAELARRV
jgi:adenylosuccinate lyase